MNNGISGDDPLCQRLKRIIVDSLKLRDLTVEKITNDEPLIGGRIGLDSLDALELYISIEDEFGFTVDNGEDSRVALLSVSHLAQYVRSHLPAAGNVEAFAPSAAA